MRLLPPLLLLPACTPTAPEDSGDPTPVVLSAVAARVHDELRTVVFVSWTQDTPAPARVKFTFDGETHTTPTRDAVAGDNEAVLLGIPYGATVSAWVEAGADASEPVDLFIEPLPEWFPPVRGVSGDPSRWDPSLAYLWLSISEDPGPSSYGLAEEWWTFVLDRAGRVVWARLTPGDAASLHPRVSHDGRDLLVDESTYWGSFDGGEDSRVLRMKIDGTLVETLPTPGLHHPFTDGPDGELWWNAYDGSDETIEERAADGTTRRVWRCSDAVTAAGGEGSCGSNTLTYQADSDTLLFSSYTLGTVFEVDRATGATERTFGQLPGSYAMDPPEANFWWQHGVHRTEAGTLLVSVYREEAGQETIVREYTIDPDARTLTESWNAGIGSGVFGRYMGEAHRLPGGNTLHNAGSEPRIREFAPDGEVVWEVDFGRSASELGDPWMGRMTPLADLYALLPDAG